MRRIAVTVPLVLAALAVLFTGAVPASAATGQVLLAATFPKTTTAKLVTNEYAYRNPRRTDRVVSPTWEMTSGSLFALAGNAWTGKVDNGRPDATSAKATNSAVFRMRSRTSTYGDVSVTTGLAVSRLTTTASTPRQNWDGVHLWLRYRSEFSLYAVSVARRDGVVVIKKKCAGGPSNDGTYYTLRQVKGVPIPLGAWRTVAASARNNPNGTVTLTASVGGKVVTTATDAGIGCAAIRAAGRVGVRGDNTEFRFTKLTVTAL
ncbi:hypothetical protein [Cryptosporangium minutisporangium]|uniref:DUF1080 domain-containing protein n=1 Tax=Cryptosporangium minutisporangium TaxID=113569 RepID=A0ABP6SVX9_9ACTN